MSQKVTILSSFPPLRGMSKYSAALVRGLPDNINVEALGFKNMYPSFLYPTDTKDDSLQLLNKKNINERSFMTWYNPLTWLYAGLTFRGQVLHVQWWHFILTPIFMVVMVCARLRGKQIITTFHNVNPHERAGFQLVANKIILLFSNHFIVHTQSNKEILSKRTNKTINVVPHGILRPDVEQTGISKEEAKSTIGLGPKDKAVLFFGIIRDYKGLDVLIKAFSEVVKKDPDAKLVIAGKPWTGEDWNDYQELICINNLEDSVIKKIGFVPEAEIEPLFVASDVVVFPYKHFDAQSGAASLALHFGKAIIVSDVGGLPELVKDDEVVLPPSEEGRLAQALTRVLTDSGFRNSLERSSQQLAGELSWTTIGSKTDEVYAQLLKG